jgi:hypothetical protein
MDSLEKAMEDAIGLIERFLRTTEDGTRPVPGMLRQISQSIEQTKTVRDKSMHRHPPGPTSSERYTRYRLCLEKLRARLKELENILAVERNRLLDEQSRLARTKEWHSLLGRTQ